MRRFSYTACGPHADCPTAVPYACSGERNVEPGYKKSILESEYMKNTWCHSCVSHAVLPCCVLSWRAGRYINRDLPREVLNICLPVVHLHYPPSRFALT